MIPRMQYKNYPVTLIRPLCYCLEENIIEHAREHGYYGWTCTCNFQDNSFRKDARRRLALFTDGSADKKEKFFWSLKNIDMEYLPCFYMLKLQRYVRKQRCLKICILLRKAESSDEKGSLISHR